MEAKVKWIANMQFVGKSDSQHAILMDTSPEKGGTDTAPTPMELLLISLGGYTGMDVVSILRKMKINFKSVNIEIKGERTSEHPRVYKKIELVYKVKGNNIPNDKVKKAIELSQEKYCSISAMLKPRVEINYVVEMEKGGD